MEASIKAKLHHKVREPARSVDMVPSVKRDSLVSGVKFAEVGYAILLTPNELFIYDGKDLKITVNHDAILQGWREPGPRGMWIIPLQRDIDLKSQNIFVHQKR